MQSGNNHFDKKIKRRELLAPAGSFEALRAAVENGADAVYLGGKLFNARASAANFEADELKRAVTYAHEREVKIYVTVNILVADREFPELADYLYEL
jgi:putative protease